MTQTTTPPVAFATHNRLPSPTLNRLLELPSARHHSTGLSDSQLLCAEEAIIPFDPNGEPFLQTQLAWAHATDHPLAVRLLTGPAGSGKTRLALALCQHLQAQGWQTGFLRSHCDPTDAATLGRMLWDAGQDYCIVLDAAETRQPVLLTLLQTLLANRQTTPTPIQVRVLLLTRHSGDWWHLLPGQNTACEALLESAARSGPCPLPPLHASEEARQGAYQLALRTFAERLNLSLPEAPPPRLDDAHLAHPLYLQMAALLALRGEHPCADALAHALVRQEQRYWNKALREHAQVSQEQEQQATLLMTLATLSGGIARDRDIEPLWRSLGQDKAQLKMLFKTLTRLYPDRQGLQGLRPDLLGEALVAQTLLGSHGARVLDAVLAKGDPQVNHTSLTVLARLLRDPADNLTPRLEEALSHHLCTCVSELMAVCIETPSPLPLLIERVFRTLPKQQRWQIAGAAGKQIAFNVRPLLALKVLFCDTSLDKAKQKLNPSKPQTLSDYAAALAHLSVALHYSGAHDAALNYSKEAVETYQTLAQTKPERFEPDWALALNNYASDLADHGQHDAALTAARQALVIYQRLAQTDSARYRYEQERARLTCAFWQWLATQTSMQDALDVRLPEMPFPREDSDLAFQWSALSALTQARTEQAPSALREALRTWSALDQTQKNQWEDFYILLAAWAAHQFGTHATAAAERGHQPLWMSEVARRVGFELQGEPYALNARAPNH